MCPLVVTYSGHLANQAFKILRQIQTVRSVHCMRRSSSPDWRALRRTCAFCLRSLWFWLSKRLHRISYFVFCGNNFSFHFVSASCIVCYYCYVAILYCIGLTYLSAIINPRFNYSSFTCHEEWRRKVHLGPFTPLEIPCSAQPLNPTM